MATKEELRKQLIKEAWKTDTNSPSGDGKALLQAFRNYIEGTKDDPTIDKDLVGILAGVIATLHRDHKYLNSDLRSSFTDFEMEFTALYSHWEEWMDFPPELSES